ncbi:MAG TPA: hypothetical protein VFC03_00540 [Acidimicrobiales bacterium]|nr:hypothetical protein [Acidimicrobiales bacterium]
MALRFVTTKAKVRWGKVALDLVVGAVFGDVVSNSYSGNAKVVATNDSGKHRVVESVDTEQSVEDRMAIIQSDYDLLSTQAWCEKYGVPVPFAQG